WIERTGVIGDFGFQPTKTGASTMLKSIREMLFISTFILTLAPTSAPAQNIPTDYQEVLKSLDKKGDFKDGVLKVNVPRNDLKMTVQGISTPTPFGFGGWVAFTKTTDGNEVMMGDLVLLQDEVNAVMSGLVETGSVWMARHS